MAFTDYGYDLVRGYLVTKITHAAIISDTGTEICRIPVDGVKVTVSDDADQNKITVTAVLKGDGSTHSNIKVGTTVKGMKLYDVATDGKPIDDETYASAFTFNNPEDQLTLKIVINAPAV